MLTSENDPLPPEELARLEQLHQKMKDEAEAWQNLLENLRKMKTRPDESTETPNPIQKPRP